MRRRRNRFRRPTRPGVAWLARGGPSVARDVASLARHTRSLQPRARSLPALSGGEWRRRALTAVALTAGLAGAALATWALWFEPRRLVVRRRTLRLPRWPDALDGLTVAVLSDLHAGAPHVKEDRIERLVARVNREAPDLVVLLGDVIDPAVKLGGWVAPEAVASRLAALRAPLGTLAVLGNHDWLHDGPRVGRALSDAGIRVLEDEAVRITHRGSPLWVAGAADLRSRRPDPSGPFRNLPPGDPVLALTHDPDLWPALPDRPALTLAGHTHSGQVDVPLIRRWAIPSEHGDRFRAGLHEQDGRLLLVTAGIGTSGLPARLLAPPEVPLLRLTPAT